jgi:hypothetical protein
MCAIGCVSCGPSQRELAVWKINEGKQLLANGDTISAMAIFDSIQVLYPKASVQIGVSKNINNDLARQIVERKRNELVRIENLIIQLEGNFIQEKTMYDKYQQYIHKSQTFHTSWKRSYLGIHLDERGELFLSSNYMGKEKINHTGIRVYDGLLSAESEKIDICNPLNHQSEFNNIFWEKVTYMNGKADAVIQFIASHPELKLKCVFLGNQQYYILLESFDIKAVADALALSKAIKKKKQIEQEISNLRS